MDARWLGWSKPDQHMLKINIHGSLRNNATKGDFIGGFCIHLEYTDTEVAAILEGLRLCSQMNIFRFIIETHSLLAFEMIQRKIQVHWQTEYLVRQVWALLEDPSCLQLIYREQNRVADMLAKEAHGLPDRHDFLD